MKTIMAGIKKERIAATQEITRSKISQVTPLNDAGQVTDRAETEANLAAVTEHNQVVNE